MKKDRDIAVPYPIYPPYQQFGYQMPIGPIGPVGPIGTIGYNTQNSCSSTSYNSGLESQINSLNEQISLLDKRVTNLETMYNNKYNSSNYQMM